MSVKRNYKVGGWELDWLITPSGIGTGFLITDDEFEADNQREFVERLDRFVERIIETTRELHDN